MTIKINDKNQNMHEMMKNNKKMINKNKNKSQYFCKFFGGNFLSKRGAEDENSAKNSNTAEKKTKEKRAQTG